MNVVPAFKWRTFTFLAAPEVDAAAFDADSVRLAWGVKVVFQGG